jgi:hypothetical protein
VKGQQKCSSNHRNKKSMQKIEVKQEQTYENKPKTPMEAFRDQIKKEYPDLTDSDLRFFGL